MTMTKKILSLILAIVICLTSVPFAFAADTVTTIPGEITTEPVTTVPSDEDIAEEITATQPTTEVVTTEPAETTEPDEETTVPDTEPAEPEEETTVPDTEPTEPEEKEPLKDNDVVANLYVYLDESSVHPMGHTWIYVENLTDQELTVGLYKLQPDEGVSIGLFKRKDGWTIYYNIEAYSQTVYGMSGQISLKEELTLRELRRVTNTIVYYPNHWDPIFNCMFFSFLVWDVASFKILLPLLFPIIGKVQMLIYPHEFDVPMKPVTKEQTFRQSGMAWFATLVPTSDRVLGPV